MSYQSVFQPGLFAGQVIVVAGGSSGFGRCIVEGFPLAETPKAFKS